MKRESFSLVAAVILMLTAIPVAATGVAFAQEPTLVYISPASQTVSPGQVFTVDVYVEPAVPIMVVYAGLNFDPVLLTADRWEEGNLLNQNGDPTFLGGGIIDNVAGDISTIGGAVFEDPVSLPGSFVTITFTAGETPGTSPLDLYDVIVRDILNQSVEIAVTGGNVTIEEAPPKRKACFIATAAYGTPMAEEIGVLREFRDQYMLTNPVGELLVDLYYETSPPVAEFIDDHPALKPIVRAGLMPAVALSTVAVKTTLAEKISMVSGLLLVSLALGIWLRRRAARKKTYFAWGQ